MNKYIPPEPVWQPKPEYLVQAASGPAFAYLGVCPHAQSFLCYSLTHHAQILYCLPCRRWSCRLCAETKIKRIACSVRRARPNRLLTLTINPALYESPRDAFEQTSKKVPLLIRKLRKKFGEVEYLRVTEVTKNGWPHYHLLVRSGYLPHAVVKALWSEMTGAKIVDLRQVKQSFHAYQYLVKYLSKLHKLEWTERHVSMSKQFAEKDEWEPENPVETAEGEFHSFHPAFFLCERFEGCTIKRLSLHSHLILAKGSPNAN